MVVLNFGNLSYSLIESNLYSVVGGIDFFGCIESSIPSVFSVSETNYLNWLSDLIVPKAVPIVMEHNGFNIITRVPNFSSTIIGGNYVANLGNGDNIKIISCYDEWYYVMVMIVSLPVDLNYFVKCDTFDGVKELFTNLMRNKVIIDV